MISENSACLEGDLFRNRCHCSQLNVEQVRTVFEQMYFPIICIDSAHYNMIHMPVTSIQQEPEKESIWISLMCMDLHGSHSLRPGQSRMVKIVIWWWQSREFIPYAVTCRANPCIKGIYSEPILNSYHQSTYLRYRRQILFSAAPDAESTKSSSENNLSD